MSLCRDYLFIWPMGIWRLDGKPVWNQFRCFCNFIWVQLGRDYTLHQGRKYFKLTHVICPTLPHNPHCVCYHVLYIKYIYISLFCSFGHDIEGRVCPKVRILSSFTHPRVIPNLKKKKKLLYFTGLEWRECIQMMTILIFGWTSSLIKKTMCTSIQSNCSLTSLSKLTRLSRKVLLPSWMKVMSV